MRLESIRECECSRDQLISEVNLMDEDDTVVLTQEEKEKIMKDKNEQPAEEEKEADED